MNVSAACNWVFLQELSIVTGMGWIPAWPLFKGRAGQLPLRPAERCDSKRPA